MSPESLAAPTPLAAVSTSQPSLPGAPVFSGHLCLRAVAGAAATVIREQSFRAPFHLSKPYWDGQALILQVVNPTAGILEGDQLRSDIGVGPGAALLVTSPSATRVFRMKVGAASSRQRFAVEAGGWLEFWPEPLVPHQGSVFHQSTALDVAPGGAALFADFLLPGRMARGEAWGWNRLVLELDVRVGGERILRERLDQSGAELRALAGLAGMGSTAAFGNLVVIAPELENEAAWRPGLQALHGGGTWVGVSRLRGSHPAYGIKLIAVDGERLRQVHREVRRVVSILIPRLKADPRKL